MSGRRRHWGKWIGAAIGLVVLRRDPPLGVLLGLIVGHLFDLGLFGRRAAATESSPRAAADPRLVEAYRLLGVPADASDGALRRAWQKRMAEHHPDRHVGASAERRAEAERISRAINAAYDRIRAARARS
jgi:hypothetical protein